MKSIAWGKFVNNGQTCIAPDYLYAHESIKGEFVTELVACIEKQYGLGNVARDNDDYCQIVNDSHYQRIKRLLTDAQARGGKLVTGGQTDDTKRFIAPTLIEGMARNAAVMSEEIFGPLLPIITFTDLDEVISYINSKPKPLALYIF